MAMTISVIEENNSMDKILELLRVKPVIQVFNQFREKMRQIIGISGNDSNVYTVIP